MKTLILHLILPLLWLTPAFAADSAANPSDPFGLEAEDARREKAIAAYTQKMKDANYPALFEKAAQEFNVPADVLKAVSFAETRWEHLQWPPGETVSPENGMPRPYGIMSLWDNDYFGHNLQTAAQLIGKSPDELKADPFQNMRGGAALLRQLYDTTPKPADAPGDEIESWRYAIAKYTGIPQPELSAQHALRVYKYMNEGYHQFGIEWPAHPVKLEPMTKDVARIKTEARVTLEAKMKTDLPSGMHATVPPPSLASQNSNQTPAPTNTNSVYDTFTPTPAAQIRQRWLLLGLMVVLLVIAALYLSKKRTGSKPVK